MSNNEHSEKEVAAAKKKHKAALDKKDASKRGVGLRKIPLAEVPAAAQVVLENVEYRERFAKHQVFTVAFLVLALIVAISVLLSVVSRPPLTLSYLSDEEGRLVQMAPLNVAGMTDSEVMSWTSNMIRKVHHLSFTDYLDHIYGMRPNFTEKAFIEFQKAILSTKAIDKIKKDRLIMHSEPLEAPRITQKGLVNGIATWVIEQEILQKTEGGEYTQVGNELKVTVTVQRTSRSHNLSGLIIKKYLVKEL